MIGPWVDRTMFKEYQITSIQHLKNLTESKTQEQNQPFVFVTAMIGNNQNDLKTKIMGFSFNSTKPRSVNKSYWWNIHQRFVMPISIRRGFD